MVAICTTSLTFNNPTFCPHSVFMCFVWISEQTAIISLYNINWLVFRRVSKIAKGNHWLHVCPSVRTEQLGSHRTDFHEICYLAIFLKSIEKTHVSLKPEKNNRYFTWRLVSFMIISLWFPFRMRNVSDKSCRENRNTHFLFSNFFFPQKLCRLWDNVEKYGSAGQATDDSVMRRMRIACWMTTAANIHSEYVILIDFSTSTMVARTPLIVTLTL